MSILSALNPMEWLALILGGMLVIFFIIASIWSLSSFIRLLVRGWKGQKIQYSPEETPSNIRGAVIPTDTRQNIASTDTSIVTELDRAKLIKDINTFIKSNNDLVAKYIELLNRISKEDNSDDTAGKM